MDHELHPSFHWRTMKSRGAKKGFVFVHGDGRCWNGTSSSDQPGWSLAFVRFPHKNDNSCSYEYFHDNHVDLIQSYLFSILFFAMSDYQTAHLHIGHREVVFAWRKRTRCVSFSGWPVFCSGSVFSWFSRGRKWAPLGRASERTLRSPSLMPSSWLAVVNRGILELTRDVYTDDRRILLLLWISRTNPKSF